MEKKAGQGALAGVSGSVDRVPACLVFPPVTEAAARALGLLSTPGQKPGA